MNGGRAARAPPSMREQYKLANRPKGHGAYDRTRYGRMRASPTSFVTSHTADLKGGSSE